MAPADNTPDFDNMTPEEIMAWMETLAKRQGVKDEELTTSANADIAEIDPDTVVIDEPGYVPYGEERPAKPEKAAAPPPAAPADASPRPAAPPTPAMPPARPPAAPPTPAMPPARPPAAPPSFQPRQEPPPTRPEPAPPAAFQPREEPPPAQSPLPLPSMDTDDEGFETKVTGTGSADAMAWLESLAADQGDALFNIDLSTLESEMEGTVEAAKPADAVSPVDWLNDLTNTQGEASAPPVAGWQAPESAAPQADEGGALEVSDPFAAGVDPIAWLENLARRSGDVKEEELTTNTPMNIPVPENAVIDEPGYKPFSFDAPLESRRPPREPEPQLELENPSDWLQSLSDSEGFDENAFSQPEAGAEALSVDAVEHAIASGTVSPEQMQYCLEHQTERYIESMDGETTDADEDGPPVPAELPDWLLEQVGAPPVAAPPEEQHPSEPPALTEEIQIPPAVADMPDWLKEDIDAEGDINFEDIFAGADVEAPAPAAVVTPEPVKQTPAFDTISLDYTVEVDPNDPWVEAFDLEHEQGMADIHSIPDWYAQNLADPKRIADVEAQARSGEPEAALADAALPDETELPVGQLESLPDWLQDAAPTAAEAPDWLQAAAPEGVLDVHEAEDEIEWYDVEVTTPQDVEPAVANIPDWLREMEVTVEPEEIPDWLKETMDEQQDTGFDPFAPDAEPEPMVVSTPAAPAPLPAAPPAAPVRPPAPTSATLDTARALTKEGNVDTALVEYESLIRASRDLEFVVDDLTSLVKQYKSSPSVYRVLGDGLMRQGNLQAALDVYREALNQL